MHFPTFVGLGQTRSTKTRFQVAITATGFPIFFFFVLFCCLSGKREKKIIKKNSNLQLTYVCVGEQVEGLKLQKSRIDPLHLFSFFFLTIRNKSLNLPPPTPLLPTFRYERHLATSNGSNRFKWHRHEFRLRDEGGGIKTEKEKGCVGGHESIHSQQTPIHDAYYFPLFSFSNCVI